MFKFLKNIQKRETSSKDELKEECMVSEGEYTLVPEVLSVIVEDHDLSLEPRSDVPTPDSRLPDKQCRSYLTRGLVNNDQREVMFVLATTDKVACIAHENDIFNLFSFIYHQAVEGNSVNSGEYTSFEEKAPFNIPYCGIAYLESVDGPGPFVPEDALLAVFLHPDECSVAANSSVYRVAAWLAYRYRIFPYPKFSDPSRSGSIPANLDESLLQSVPLMKEARRVSVILQDKTLTVTFTGDSLSVLSQNIDVAEKNKCFGITSGHVKKADSRLVWLPNRDNPEAVGIFQSDSPILEGGFIIIAGDHEEDGAMILEDGFSVLLCHESWLRLIECITAGTNFDLPLGGNDERYIKHLYIVKDGSNL